VARADRTGVEPGARADLWGLSHELLLDDISERVGHRDVVFRQAQVLRRLYPRLVHYGISTLGSTDVLRYLGRPVRLDGEVPKSFRGEVSSDLRRRNAHQA
jgi:hypothetical protein